jgi:hypothetical protein
MDFLGYVLGWIIIGGLVLWIAWGFLYVFASPFVGGGTPEPPRPRVHFWKEPFWRDTKPRCYGGCGTVIRDRTHCPECAAKVTAASAAKREQQRKLDRLKNELARRERQRERRELAKTAKCQTSTPPTGPVVLKAGEAYRP